MHHSQGYGAVSVSVSVSSIIQSLPKQRSAAAPLLPSRVAEHKDDPHLLPGPAPVLR